MKFGTLLQLYKDKKYEPNQFIDYQKIKSTKFTFQERLEYFQMEINKLKDLLKQHISNKDELFDISRWLLINQISIRKLIKKLSNDGLSALPEELSQNIHHFLNEKLDELTLKKILSNGTAPTGNTFERKSIKYIIPEIYLHLVIEYLAKHLPIVQYPNASSYWTFIRSVYLDNQQFELYDNRIKKNPESITLRYRKYDNLDKIYLERKKHSDEVLENSYSKKERVEVLFPSNVDFPYELGKLSSEFDSTIQEKKLHPSIGVSYSRIAFGNESVRVCLDSNIMFYNLSEYIKSIKRKHNQVVDLSKLIQFPIKMINVGKDKRFHFGILEVKLTSKENSIVEIPEWLELLIQNEWIISIPKLSKFLTGSYFIHNNDINMLFPNQSPYWIPQMSALLDRFSPLHPTLSHQYPQLLIVPKGLRPEILMQLDKLFLKRTMISLKLLLMNVINNRRYFSLPLILLSIFYFSLSIVNYQLESNAILNRTLRRINMNEKYLLAIYYGYFILSFIYLEMNMIDLFTI